MESMWKDAEVRKEWDDVGETMGQKVHLSRDPDGEPYITQVEMKVSNKSILNDGTSCPGENHDVMHYLLHLI